MVRHKHAHADRLTDRQINYSLHSQHLFIFVCSFFALLSGEVRTDVQTSAGLSDRWSGEAPTAAAATAAASGGCPVCLVLPHQGQTRPLPTAPSAHGLLLQRGRRAAVLHRWCSPVPGVLPERVADVGYDLQRLRCLSHIEIPGEGGQRRTLRRKRWGICLCASFTGCGSLHPPLLILYLSLLLMSGFDSRQPSHDLMGIHPYNPLEDPYSLFPHSLRNMGERTAQWANMHVTVSYIFFKYLWEYFFFQMSCVPAWCVPTERPASTEWRSCRLSGGNCSAERRSKPTRAKYINQITGFFFLVLRLPLSFVWPYSSSLKPKHAISDGLRRLLTHQTENLFHYFPPPLLLSLWSHGNVQFKVNDFVDPPKIAFNYGK